MLFAAAAGVSAVEVPKILFEVVAAALEVFGAGPGVSVAENPRSLVEVVAAAVASATAIRSPPVHFDWVSAAVNRSHLFQVSVACQCFLG